MLIDQRPDALLNIIDATNLERNLYLTTQLAELGIPMVVALNMMDVVRKNGDRIDAAKLSNHLGVPVVEISALKGDGVMEAAQRAVQMARSGKKTIPQHRFAGSIEHALAHIEEVVLHDMPEERQRWVAVKIFERDERIIEKLNIPKDKLAHIENDIKACETEMDDDSQSIITAARYTYIASIIDGCVKKSNRGMSTSDKIDRVLTNRILGLPIFAAVMTLVYYIAISTVGGALTDWTNDVFVGEWIVPAAQSFFEGIGCADWLTGLIVDGVISGVGAVLGFVPQMLVLFLLLCILEDCGYMARIAFIMDRVFRRFGLSGKSFIPMLVGTGCGVPGVMASRTIEQERDRRMTIMTTTFIPCGAKMPIVGRDFRRRVVGCAERLLHRHCGHRHLRHHPQEDQALRGRARPVRHGASGVSSADREERAARHLGARLELHQEGRHDHYLVLRVRLVHQLLRLCGRRVRHGGGYGRLHPCEYRQRGLLHL